MPNPQRVLPLFLLEDCLALLRLLVGAAWFGVAVLVGVELYVRLSDPSAWPRYGLFSTGYHVVLAEFSINTALLTLLLVQRDWYERVPRRSLDRVRWLLAAVLVWIVLHTLAAFHVTGGVAGPMLPMVPVLVVGALLSLPGAPGRWLALFIIAGHGAVVALEHVDWLDPRGPLAHVFTYADPATPLGVGTLGLILMAATVVAWLAQDRVDASGLAIHHANRFDAGSGLFRRAFLEERIGQELRRIRRQGDSAVLLLVRLDALTDDGTGEQRLRAVGQKLLGLVRTPSDTPARYGLATLAVLLPTSDADGAQVVAQRISEGLAEPEMRFGAAVVARAENLTPQQVCAAADRALHGGGSGAGVPTVKLGA